MAETYDLILDSSRLGIAMGLYSNAENYEIYDHEARGESVNRLLDTLLLQASTSLENIHRVMVTLGPGSFTGLRNGIAYAQGLCFSGKRKLYGVSTLQALSAQAKNPAESLVIIKARPEHWYLRKQGEESFLSTTELLKKLSETPQSTTILGDLHAQTQTEIQNKISQQQQHFELIEDKNISKFRVFFDTLVPSLVQEANYIQASYAQI